MDLPDQSLIHDDERELFMLAHFEFLQALARKDFAAQRAALLTQQRLIEARLRRIAELASAVGLGGRSSSSAGT